MAVLHVHHKSCNVMGVGRKLEKSYSFPVLCFSFSCSFSKPWTRRCSITYAGC